MRRLALLYLALSAALVAGLYAVWAGAGAAHPPLLIEALFAWLAVFVPPLVLIERSLAVARALLALPARRSRGS
jgi:hypothetical protein